MAMGRNAEELVSVHISAKVCTSWNGEREVYWMGAALTLFPVMPVIMHTG